MKFIINFIFPTSGRPKKNRDEDRNYSPTLERPKSPDTRHKKKKKDKEKTTDKDKDTDKDKGREKEKDKDKDKDNTKVKEKTLPPSSKFSQTHFGKHITISRNRVLRRLSTNGR